MKRDYRIDFLKGVGIVTVIAGHCAVPNTLLVLIYSFHMPLFFALSGSVNGCRNVCLMKSGMIAGNEQPENSMKTEGYLKRKAAQLIYPYVILGLLVIVLNTLLDFVVKDGFSATRTWKRFIALAYGNVIWENNIDYIGTLWFLTALFSCCMLWKLLTLFKNKYVRILVETALILFGFYGHFDFRLPWCLDIAPAALLFFELGMSTNLRKISVMKKDRLTVMGIVLSAIGTIAGLLNSYDANNRTLNRTDMLSRLWRHPILYVIAAAALIVSLYLWAELLSRKFRIHFIEKIGRYSLLIMVLHLYIKIFFDAVLKRSGISVNVWIEIICILLISYVGACVIDKYFYRLYTLGRR